MRCGAFPLADDPYILHSQLGVVDPEPVALAAACPFAEEFIRKVRAPRLPKQLFVAEQAAIYRTIPEATVGANGLTDLHAPMIENLAGVPVYLFKGVHLLRSLPPVIRNREWYPSPANPTVGTT